MAEGKTGTTAVRNQVDLVTAAQAGDQKALAELLAGQLPLVYNVVGRALQGHADVDDVVQETMVRVIRGLPGLREPEKFRSWVIAIATREIQLHLRARLKIQQRRADIPPEQPDPDGDFAERTVTELLLTAQRRELTEAARWLDVDDRWLLSLWWRETLGELTRDGLAEQLTVGPKLAALRVRRMKGQLEAVRALVRALQATPRCPELARVLHEWNGDTTPVWRKRLLRHVRDCPECGMYRHGLVPPERLLLGTLPLPLAGLTPDAPATLSSIWTAIHRLFSNKILAGAAAVTVAAGGGLAYAVHESPLPPDRPQAIVQPPVAASVAAPVTGAPSASASVGPSPSGGRTPATGGGTGVATADIFVAPGGSDAGTGTADSPFATLAKAVDTVRPGQTIALRGGVYRPTAGTVITTSGRASKRITLSNYRAERPVIDAGGVPADEYAVTHEADYWTVQGLEIRNSRYHAYVCNACRYDVFQRLSVHDNVRSALTLKDAGTVGNQVLDSDFFNNYDPDERGGAGVGLAVKDGAGEGNVIRGNRAFTNADNGFDLGGFASPVVLDRNWAYGNGVNHRNVEGWQSNADGFHLGGGNPPPAAAHVLRNNAAWDNAATGFSTSGNQGALRLIHNTAFRNGRDGFRLLDADGGTVHDNAAGGNGGSPATLRDGTDVSGNSWQTGTGLFRFTDPSAAQGPRSADGTLPRVGFLATADGVGAEM